MENKIIFRMPRESHTFADTGKSLAPKMTAEDVEKFLAHLRKITLAPGTSHKADTAVIEDGVVRIACGRCGMMVDESKAAQIAVGRWGRIEREVKNSNPPETITIKMFFKKRMKGCEVCGAEMTTAVIHGGDYLEPLDDAKSTKRPLKPRKPPINIMED